MFQKIKKCDNRLLVALVFIICFMCHLSFIWRNYGSDEGQYLFFARMASNGMLPIRDYYSNQAPYFIFIYGGFMTLFGFNLISARIFSYIISSLIGVLMYTWIQREYGRKDIALISVGLLMTSFLYIFEGSPLSSAGHGQISLLFLTAALLFSSLYIENRTVWESRIVCLIIGFTLALAVWCRSPAIFPATVIFGNFLYSCFKNEHDFKCIPPISAWLLAGILFGSIPAIYLFSCRPDTFIFCLLKGSSFFSHIEPYYDFGSYPNSPWSFRANALSDFLKSFKGQTAALLILLGFSVVLVTTNKSFKKLYYPVMLQLLILSAYSYVFIFVSKHGFTWHHFGIFVPFIIMGSAPSLIYWLKNLRHFNLGMAILSLIILFHLSYGLKSIAYNLKQGFVEIKPIGIQSQKSVSKVADVIRKYTDKNDFVLVALATPLFEADRPLPNTLMSSFILEQLFIVVKDDSYKKHHLISQDELYRMIDKKHFKMIVDDPYLTPHMDRKILGTIKKQYDFIREIDNDYRIYIRKESSRI